MPLIILLQNDLVKSNISEVEVLKYLSRSIRVSEIPYVKEWRTVVSTAGYNASGHFWVPCN